MRIQSQANDDGVRVNVLKQLLVLCDQPRDASEPSQNSVQHKLPQCSVWGGDECELGND